MSKIAVVYWSGTGNTEAMADAVADGATKHGATVTKYTVSSFAPASILDFEAIAFGCPAMGSEMLEDCEFEPVFSECLPLLAGKKIALFGSYGWGEGEWMRKWESTCKNAGATLVCESVICEGSPDSSVELACSALGAALV